MDFTFVCPTEICQFSDNNDRFQSLNSEVIGCSVDSKYTHREYALKPREDGGLAPLVIPLLSDISHEVAKDYGVYIDQGPNKGVAYRGTFIIDPNGVLRQYSINDLPVGRNVDEVIRLLQGFQFVEKYGEVCPAKWKPGEKTIVPEPDSEKTKVYFKEELGKK
jgi:alkyl hydroperoxide reductase subunit AhpC